MIQAVEAYQKKRSPAPHVQVQRRAACAARAPRRRGRARSPWAARWCPTSRRSTAGGRTAAPRTPGSCSSATASAQASAPSGSSSGCSRGTAIVVRHGGQGRPQLGDDVPPVVLLAVEPVPVDGDQHGRLDLGEPVEHGAGAEVGRAGRPHRPDRRRAQEGDDRLRHVRQVAGHPVAGPHPEPAQRRGEGARPGRGASPRRSRPGRRPRRRRSARGGRRWRAAAPARRSSPCVPGNQTAPGIARSASTSSSRTPGSTPDHSATSAQNWSRCSTDQRQSAS